MDVDDCENKDQSSVDRDLTGQKFGRLTVLHDTGQRKWHHAIWMCLCECGAIAKVESIQLINTHNPTVSCGCHRRAYNVWHHMMSRCYKKQNVSFSNYGGRGITVCDRWHVFENFFADMGVPPLGMSLDRIDNDGNYHPENCRWITYKEQNNNKSNNRTLEYKGEEKTIAEWADVFGIKYETLRSRIEHGWNIEDALLTKVTTGTKRKHKRRKRGKAKKNSQRLKT